MSKNNAILKFRTVNLKFKNLKEKKKKNQKNK